MTTRRCYLLFIILCIGFLIDAIYLHYFIPWTKSHRTYKSNSQTYSNSKMSHSEARPQDVRSLSNFKTDPKLTYVPSRRTSKSELPTIPHIIHQVWDTEDIPKMYHKWVRTVWARDNPDWEYRLWTRETIRSFVSEEYPDILNIHDVYTSDIFRFDMIRYLVLYKYGGIYLDLDMESLKPLDNWTYGHQCIISEETYAHPFVVRLQDTPANIVNGFIATRPGHPFLKLAIDSLPEFAGNYLGDYLHATGPYFLNAVLERYKAKKSNHVLDDVTLLPPKYFFPTYDPNESDLISSRCYPVLSEMLDESGRKTCQELNLVFFQRTPDPMSYTDHHWVHAYLFTDEWKTKDTKPIKELVPKAVTKYIPMN